MVRNILMVALALMAWPAGAAEWWVQSGRPMAHYVAEGYSIVGFSVIPETSRVMPLVSFRYVLQKGTQAAMCTEKTSATGGNTILATCYDLAQP